MHYPVRRDFSPAPSGFTMLELSIVIVIVALLVGGTVTFGTMRVDQEKVNATKTRIDMIEKAIVAFAELNKRLPCPSYPTYASTNAKYGVESATPGSCNGDTPDTVWFVSDTAIGSIPFKTLGLPEDAMYDGWGRRFTYSVYLKMTAANALRYNKRNSTCGGITLQDDAGTTQATKGIYALVSHGADGHGAFQKNGTRFNASLTNASALINAQTNGAFAVVPSATFRQTSYYEDPANKRNRFDDILTFRARKDLVLPSDKLNETYNVKNNATPPGWMYIPEYTLPSGRVVPAFEVMKYPASNNGDGYPQSKALTAPWTNISFENARIACQKLGGYAPVGGVEILTGASNLMGYDIISETQWLAIAHQVQADSRNWENGCYGDTVMFIGHRDNAPSSVLAASDNDDNGYYLTANSGDSSLASGDTVTKRAQRRTMYLPNGGIIWDVAGNLAQWSYCDLEYTAGQSLTYAAARSAASLTDTGFSLCTGRGKTRMLEFGDAANNTSAMEHYYNFAGCMISTTQYTKYIDIQPINGFTTTVSNVGGFTTPNTATIAGVLRGDFYNGSTYTGIFRAGIGYGASAQQGFRCVRNSNPPAMSPDALTGLDIWYDASDLDADGVEEGTSESGITTGGACTKTTTPKYNGCVQVWKNKAKLYDGTGNTNYNARSKRNSGAASGNDENMPTLRLNQINGKAAVNFDGSLGPKQWLETYHGVAGGGDAGTGYQMQDMSKFTIFIVASGTKLHALVTANDDNIQGNADALVLFPYNMIDDGGPDEYVFLTNHLFAGTDLATPAVNNFCSWSFSSGGGGCPNIPSFKPACARMGGNNTGTGLVGTEPHVLTGVFNSSIDNGLAAYVDGATVHIKDSAVQVTSGNLLIAPKSCGGNPVQAFLRLGTQRNYDSATWANANVAEVLIYNRALSASERRLVEEYLAEKYNITLKD